MHSTTRIADILNQYQRLASYCDGFFARVQRIHGTEMACRRGCDWCCSLQSVCGLEAAVMARHLALQPLTPDEPARGMCPLLRGGTCAVYDARPVICRTHGLLLSTERGPASSCNLNFTHAAPDELPVADILDHERITMNLMKLNLAFNMEIGRRDASEMRFDIRDILAGTLPREYVL